jgi:hypothetical protein
MRRSVGDALMTHDRNEPTMQPGLVHSPIGLKANFEGHGAAHLKKMVASNIL